MTAPPHPRLRFGILAALVVLTVAVYLRAATCGFLWGDDDWYVTANPHVQAGLSLAGVQWAFTTPGPPYWHPMTWLSLQLDYQLYGLHPGGYHLTNVLLHAANTVVLFWALCSMTRAVWRSAFAASLFALHPLHVESVAWVTERKDVLSTFFALLTIAAYVWYARRPGVRRYLLVAAALALGVMSKPMVVTLPCVLLLLDYWPLERGQAGWRRLVLEKLPMFALSAAASIMTVYSRQMASVDYAPAPLPLEARFAGALVHYVIYIRQMIWPEGLAFFYPDQPRHLTEWPVIGAGLVLLSLTTLALWQARRRPYLLVGWLWFVGTLVPVMGIAAQVRWQSRADRFTYIPLIGLNIVAAWGLAQLIQARGIRRPAVGWTAAGVLTALAALTWVQIGYWVDSITQYQRTVAVTSGHYVAHAFLAELLERDGRLTEARRQFEQSLASNPNQAEGHESLANFLLRHGARDEAIEHYEQALAIDPCRATAHNNLGVILMDQGNQAEGLSHLEAAVRCDPDLADAHDNLGAALAHHGRLAEAMVQARACVRLAPNHALARLHLGVLLETQDQLAEALTHYETAARLGLKLADLYFHLGQVRRRLEDAPGAIAAYRRATDLQPPSALYRAYLAYAYYGTGDTAAAFDHYRQAQQLDASWIAATQKAAWKAATEPLPHALAGPTAVELAEQVCQATYFRDPTLLNTLAAAYADGGRFDDAVTTARQAGTLATQSGQDTLAEQIKERLRLFQSHQPLHAH
jgi:tetratricopeptide (TPR) repeat protein